MPVKPKHAEEPKHEEKKEVVEETFIPEEPKFSLEEIILPAEVKAQILDVATYAENAHRVFELWGFKRTHKFSRRIGVNLYGAPGTGKTMAAHAIAKELGKKILIVNYADIESKYVGETPKNIRKAFEAAKKSDSILFFDEADAILSKRVTNMTQAVDVSVNQTRSVMLMLMNEYQDFIIFATNFIENFDPAFMRRISIHIKFTLPDEDCRKKLWRMYTPPEVPNNLDFDELAKKFDGISGSDISNAMLNAAFKAARLKVDELDKNLVFEAVENILASKRANARLIG
ncbi:MAG: AAA family ATPase [Selenomonadaceae bacterium]|nr:AAA family ATPase [Selenomonadaceae bacterium]